MREDGGRRRTRRKMEDLAPSSVREEHGSVTAFVFIIAKPQKKLHKRLEVPAGSDLDQKPDQDMENVK